MTVTESSTGVERQRQWLALSLTPQLGPTRGRRLVEHFGDIERVFRASLTELEAAGLPAAAAQSVALGKSLELAEDELARTTEAGAKIIAIGAMCSDLKDSQAMMQPVMILLTLPLLMSAVVLRAPGSTVAVAASLFPTATPFLMLMRLALTPPPPLWQLVLSIVLTVGTAAVLVWAAGRIFRVGLLMQGKPPNLPELLRWIRQ